MDHFKRRVAIYLYLLVKLLFSKSIAPLVPKISRGKNFLFSYCHLLYSI